MGGDIGGPRSSGLCRGLPWVAVGEERVTDRVLDERASYGGGPGDPQSADWAKRVTAASTTASAPYPTLRVRPVDVRIAKTAWIA